MRRSPSGVRRRPTPRVSAASFFVIDDIKASLADLQAHGGQLVGEPGDDPSLVEGSLAYALL